MFSILLQLSDIWFFYVRVFPGGPSGKEPIFHAGDKRDSGLIPGLGQSPGGRHNNPLQYSSLENPTDRGSLMGYSP